MKIDHIHFYVEDAAQVRDWLIQKMGFGSGGQHVSEHTHTEIVGNNTVLLRVSSALHESSPVAKYLAAHPAGVVDIAFLVDDLELLAAKIDRLDIQIMQASELVNSNSAQLTIQGWGNYQHTLIDNTNHQLSPLLVADSSYIIGIDHVVLNVAKNQLAAAANWYQNLFDFQVQQSFEIQTDYSGLSSQALVDKTGRIQFNINEPSTTNSQIQTFLDIQGGAGIQHIALLTHHIFPAVAQMRQQDLAFLPIPKSYYINLKHRSQQTTGSTDFPFDRQEWQNLEESEILLDWPADHASALLMQIFTQPIFGQSTFFFEIIERRDQVRGFGEGNFLALFQAMESSL
jgi:4-hydroxyphenylpyruvate dioxygenase